MKTRTMILFTTCGFIGAAAYSENVAAMFIAVAASGALWHLHTIEVKLNKLLDYHGLRVSSEDMDN